MFRLNAGLNLGLFLGLRLWLRSWAQASLATTFAWMGVMMLFALRGRPLYDGPLDDFGSYAIVMALGMAMVSYALRTRFSSDENADIGLSPGTNPLAESGKEPAGSMLAGSGKLH